MIRQLPETEMLHVPSRSPVSWWMRQPGLQSLDVLDAQQGGENAPDPINQIAPDAAIVVIFNKAFQPSVADGPNPHASKCTAKPDAWQAFYLGSRI